MSFENLRVYQAAELLNHLVDRAATSTRAGYGSDVNQLRRAAASVPYNIAESFGSASPGQKIYHLGIARGSTDETRAVLRKLAKAGALSAAASNRPTALAVTISKMLTAWIDHLRQKE